MCGEILWIICHPLIPCRLADIRFVHIIKAACFFYYCLLLPFIFLGKKIYWSVFRDTADKKEQAEKAVLAAAGKKGNLEKYGVVDLAAELKKFEEETEGSETRDKRTVSEKTNDQTPGMAVNLLHTKKATVESRGVCRAEIGGMPQKQTGKFDNKRVPLSGKERNTEVNIAVIVLDERQGRSEDGKRQEKRLKNSKVKRHKRRKKTQSREKKRQRERRQKATASSSSDLLDKTSLESAEQPLDRATHSSNTEPSDSAELSHSSESSAGYSGDYKSHNSHEEHEARSSDNWSKESNMESDGYTTSGKGGGSQSEGQDGEEEESKSGSHASVKEHSPSGHSESALEDSDMEWDYYSEDDSFETYSDDEGSEIN